MIQYPQRMDCIEEEGFSGKHKKTRESTGIIMKDANTDL